MAHSSSFRSRRSHRGGTWTITPASIIQIERESGGKEVGVPNCVKVSTDTRRKEPVEANLCVKQKVCGPEFIVQKLHAYVYTRRGIEAIPHRHTGQRNRDTWSEGARGRSNRQDRREEEANEISGPMSVSYEGKVLGCRVHD